MAAPPGPPPRRRGRWLVLALLLLAFAAVAAQVVDLATRSPDRSPIEIAGINESQQVFGGVRQDGARLGAPDAPVSLTVFNDMQCLECAEWFVATVPPLVEERVRDEEISLSYRDYSFSPRPVELAFYGAAAAAEQDYRWQYNYLFMRSIDEARERGVGEDLLEAVAASIPDLDVALWREDFRRLLEPESGQGERFLANDEFARQLGLRAEPSVLVAGPRGRRTLQDTPSREEIEAAIAAVAPAAG